MDMPFNRYGRRRLRREQVEAGVHRKFVGGLWDEMGALQFDFLVESGGLTPDMTLLDLGCGSLRGGVRFVEYLNPGNYYGLDLNESLVEAGYTVEIPRAGLEGRLERDHLRVTDDFDATPFGVSFDRVIAVSVWSHLPFNHIQRSLYEVSRVLEPEGSFYTSFFVADEARLMQPVDHEPGGVTTHRDRDPFHYLWEDILYACRPFDLGAELVGDWNHPRDQQMARFWLE